jgi:hypothetical protein
MDLGNTIIFDVNDTENKVTNEFIICDDCARKIAIMLIER